MSRLAPAHALVAARFGFGGVSWLAPKLLLRTLGARHPDDPAATWTVRMFAVRDAALGAGVMCTAGAHRRLWLKIGLACDLADLAGGVIAARHPDQRRALLTFSPLVGVALGAAALRQERNGP